MAGEARWVCKVVEGRLAVDAHVSKKRFPWFVSHTLKVIRHLTHKSPIPFCIDGGLLFVESRIPKARGSR